MEPPRAQMQKYDNVVEEGNGSQNNGNQFVLNEDNNIDAEYVCNL